MTKLTKKLFMSLCLSLFAICIGLCGLTLNTAYAEDVETPAEPAVANFVGLVGDGAFVKPDAVGAYGVFLEFDLPLRPEGDQYGWGTASESGDLGSKLTWNGEAVVPFNNVNFYVNKYVTTDGADSKVLEIYFANGSESKLEHRDVLHIPAGTLFGEVQLAEVTIYYNMAENKWQTTYPKEDYQRVAKFVGINHAQNNVKWEYFELWDALYLMFDVEFEQGEYSGPVANSAVSEVNASDWEENGHPTHDGIYWYSPDDPENKNYFVRIFANWPELMPSGNANTLCLLNWEKWAQPGDILVIEEGTTVGEVVLPALTLYCVEGSLAIHPNDKSTAHWVPYNPNENVEPDPENPENPSDPGTSDPATSDPTTSDPTTSDPAAEGSCTAGMGVTSVLGLAVIAFAGVLTKKKEN